MVSPLYTMPFLGNSSRRLGVQKSPYVPPDKALISGLRRSQERQIEPKPQSVSEKHYGRSRHRP